jgi:hypothetical protein
MKTAIILGMVMLATPALSESPYCMPKADGTNRLPKTGSSCPTGYFATGRCCEALHKDTPFAMPKIKGAACPSGTFQSGDACKRF